MEPTRQGKAIITQIGGHKKPDVSPAICDSLVLPFSLLLSRILVFPHCLSRSLEESNSDADRVHSCPFLQWERKSCSLLIPNWYLRSSFLFVVPLQKTQERNAERENKTRGLLLLILLRFVIAFQKKAASTLAYPWQGRYLQLSLFPTQWKERSWRQHIAWQKWDDDTGHDTATSPHRTLNVSEKNSSKEMRERKRSKNGKRKREKKGKEKSEWVEMKFGDGDKQNRSNNETRQ